MPKVRIRRLLAWSPALSTLHEQAIAAPDFALQSDANYIPLQISSAQGRRLSELTKTSVDLALRISEGQKIDQVIFSSRHGELLNSFQLLKMIGRQEVLSPTGFSQSVHNTAVGTYTLIQKIHAAATSLGGGANSFMMGLISSFAYLQENPNAEVLYISADVAVPEIFAQGLQEDNVPAVVAMILSTSKPAQLIEFSEASEEASMAGSKFRPQAVEFLEWFFSDSLKLKIGRSPIYWSLQKCFEN